MWWKLSFASCTIYFNHCRDHMVVGFRTTCAISAYHHWSCVLEPRSWRDVLDTTLCDKVCQWLATGRWFSPGTLFSSTNKTDRHDITEIVLKVALNTINQAVCTNVHWFNNYSFNLSTVTDIKLYRVHRVMLKILITNFWCDSQRYHSK
jgi:hypothetical protein